MPSITTTSKAANVSGLPVGFLRFIAVAEISGGLGLVLPGLFRIRRELTPIAGLGLIVIMAGATTLTVATQGVAPAVMPLVTGIVLAIVVRGRGVWLSFPARGVMAGSVARG